MYPEGFHRLLIAVFPLLMMSSGCDVAYDLLVAPEISVGTHDMSFTAVEGGEAPAAQVTTASCTSPDSSTSSVLDTDDCGANVTSDKEWLTVTPASITGQKDITVSVVTTGLTAGTHTGNIHVEYDLVSIDDEEDIAVTLTVTAP